MNDALRHLIGVEICLLLIAAGTSWFHHWVSDRSRTWNQKLKLFGIHGLVLQGSIVAALILLLVLVWAFS